VARASSPPLATSNTLVLPAPEGPRMASNWGRGVVGSNGREVGGQPCLKPLARQWHKGVRKGPRPACPVAAPYIVCTWR
jgi:hypothetical protein